jgi:hypothetical protein
MEALRACCRRGRVAVKQEPSPNRSRISTPIAISDAFLCRVRISGKRESADFTTKIGDSRIIPIFRLNEGRMNWKDISVRGLS